MSISVDWGDSNKTHLVWSFEDEPTIEEFKQSLLHASHLTHTRPYIVDAILDVRQLRTSSLNLVQFFRETLNAIHTANFGLAIFVSKNRIGFWSHIYRTANYLYFRDQDRAVVFVASLKDARELIYHLHKQNNEPS